jgi:hypothetical protein
MTEEMRDIDNDRMNECNAVCIGDTNMMSQAKYAQCSSKFINAIAAYTAC